jgi:hypothetical protein
VVQPPPLTECTYLGVGHPLQLTVGESRALGPFLEHCRPMFFPLPLESVTYRSLNPERMRVEQGRIRAVASGPAVIEVSHGRMSQQGLVVGIVGAGPDPSPSSSLVSFEIYGAPTMAVNQRGMFAAYATFEDSTTRYVTFDAEWASSHPGIVGIVPFDGAQPPAAHQRPADAFIAGTTTISATYRSRRASMIVTVQPTR